MIQQCRAGRQTKPHRATDALTQHIAAKSGSTVAIGKEAFYCRAEPDLAEAHRFTSEVMTRNMHGHDAGEGIDAFLGKRQLEGRDR